MKVPTPLIDNEAGRNRRSLAKVASAALLGALLTACEGAQSALAPAGDEAERVFNLFVVMLAAACLIWLAVFGTAVYAMRVRPHEHEERTASHFIFWGGIVFPVGVLTVLLLFGLPMLANLRPPGDGLRIGVSGEQWWWRVTYHSADQRSAVVSANEIRLPVGERTEFILDSPDVIHSFWIPSLGGKLDMVPGRTTRLTLEPTRTGTFRGVCAEFCGPSHALMAFPVVVMEREAFDLWLEARRAPAAETTDEPEGRELFLQAGCGSCHTIRGTPAAGVIGPDLTHVGSRLALGAGILPNDAPTFARFIRDAEEIKPGSLMPSFSMLPDAEISAIARYLDSLE